MSALRTIPTRMKELLVKSRTLVVAATLLLMAWPAAIQAQEEGGLGLTVFAGAQNSPTAFDAFRSVEYDAGVRMGAGLVFFIDERGKIYHTGVAISATHIVDASPPAVQIGSIVPGDRLYDRRMDRDFFVAKRP